MLHEFKILILAQTGLFVKYITVQGTFCEVTVKNLDTN